jgi:hypothetical protein
MGAMETGLQAEAQSFESILSLAVLRWAATLAADAAWLDAPLCASVACIIKQDMREAP